VCRFTANSFLGDLLATPRHNGSGVFLVFFLEECAYMNVLVARMVALARCRQRTNASLLVKSSSVVNARAKRRYFSDLAHAKDQAPQSARALHQVVRPLKQTLEKTT
jgi:hypothetical protein